MPARRPLSQCNRTEQTSRGGLAQAASRPRAVVWFQAQLGRLLGDRLGFVRPFLRLAEVKQVLKRMCAELTAEHQAASVSIWRQGVARCRKWVFVYPKG